MIRKLKSGEYRLYSRKADPKTGKRRNLGTFPTRAAAEQHERAVQFFKHNHSVRRAAVMERRAIEVRGIVQAPGGPGPSPADEVSQERPQAREPVPSVDIVLDDVERDPVVARRWRSSVLNRSADY